MSGIFRITALTFIIIATLIAIATLAETSDGLDARTLVLAGLFAYGGAAFYFAFRKRSWTISRIEGCLLVVAIWVLMPVPVALAFLSYTDISIIDAMFEAVSALTTTGSSVFVTLDNVPLPVIVLRSLVQWFGGLITLIVIITVLAPLGLAGLPANQATIINREATLFRGDFAATSYTIAGFYGGITIACFSLLVVTEVPIYTAFNLSLATVSSGGFLPTDEPIAEIGNAFTRYVLILFMVLAGSSIIWQRFLVSGRWQSLKNHREAYFYGFTILTLGIVYAAVFFERAGSADVLPPSDALSEGLFTAASLVSTTGFEIRNGSFAVLPAALVIAIVLIGGCSFSTAGGISFYRLGGMANHALNDLNKLVYPSGVYSARFGTQRYDISLMKAIWIYFFAVMFVVMIGTLFLALRMDSFEAAVIASISAFSNIGAAYTTGWAETGQWIPYNELDMSSKVTLCVLMILGRLHILTVLTALNKTYWMRAR